MDRPSSSNVIDMNSSNSDDELVRFIYVKHFYADKLIFKPGIEIITLSIIMSQLSHSHFLS